MGFKGRYVLLFLILITNIVLAISPDPLECDLEFDTPDIVNFNCDPATNCGCNKAGVMVTDPADCHNYYLCITSLDEEGNEIVTPSSVALTCENNNYFDGTVCAKEDYTCANSCAKKGCDLNCDDPNSNVIADPSDCQKYKVCVEGGSIEAVCPTGTPYFNGEGCGANIYDCCDVCTPYCEHENTEAIDPYDCKSFYICLHDNSVPQEKERYECGSSQYFDSNRGTCEEEDPLEPTCSPLCS